MPRAVRESIIPVYLFCCLLLGGSTRAPWSNMALQLGAVAILGWAALGRPHYKAGRPGALLAVIVGATVGLIGLQLVPLPPVVWNALPGREMVAHGYDLLGQPHPWLPLSLAPYDTLTSALWLLPPLAILAGILRLDAFRELWTAIAVVLAALIGVILGAQQLVGGGDVASPWYIYAITNDGAAVGFFANANHMAILLVSTLPFLVAMYGSPRKEGASSRARASAGKTAILGGAMMVMIVGILLNGSLAGVALGAIALAASMFVRASLDERRTRWGLAVVGIGGILAMAAMVASPLQNNLTTVGVENVYSSRYTSFANSLRAAADHFPVGSGIGTFADIYPSYENPAWVDRWYINHVHNDYIEIGLEAGFPGILLLASFILWWMLRTIAIWRAAAINHYARAATIASAAILFHSLVDFPLRTTSIAAIFAVCLAMMAGMRRRAAVALPEPSNEHRARHLSIG